MRFLGYLAGFVLVFGFYFATSSAQTTEILQTTETAAAESSLAAGTEILPSDLGVSSPNFWQFFKRRFSRIITRQEVKKAKLSLELADLTLLKARQAQKNGDNEKAGELLLSYNQQVTGLQTQINTLTGEIGAAFQPNTALLTLLSRLEQNRLFGASILDSMSLKASGEFNQKIIKTRLEVVKDLSRVLLKQNLTAEELAQKLDKISQKLADKEAKTEEKYLKRLKALEEIDEVDELDDDLEEAIGQVEKDTLEKAAREPVETISLVARKIEGGLKKHVLILEELLSRAPDPAKPAIENAIERSQKKLEEELKKDPQRLEKILENDKENIEAKKKIMERLNKMGEEETKKSIERKDAEVKKQEEKAKQRVEKKKEEGKKDEENKPKESPVAGTTETPATETRQSKTYELKIKKDGFEKTGLTLKKGDKIMFKNDDDSPHDIASNPHPFHTQIPGLRSGVLNQDQTYTFTFETAGNFGVHDHLNTQYSVSIIVED